MSFGVRVWDQSGNVTMDITDRTGRFAGLYTVPAMAKRTGVTVAVPGYTVGSWMFSGDIPYWISVTQQANGLYFFNVDYYATSSPFTVRVYKA